jgi:CsoR family transcriptional regulator, copper-sensing transcriptional repressor
VSTTKTTKSDYHYQTESEALLMRLRRMEGQVRGVQKMIEEGRYCVDIVTQLQAISAAANKVAEQVLEGHIRGCVADAIKEQRGDEAITELMTVLSKAIRS